MDIINKEVRWIRSIMEYDITDNNEPHKKKKK